MPLDLGFREEEVDKTMKIDDVEPGEEVNENNIDLSMHDSNITITKAGQYTLKGDFKSSLLVNTDGEVKLVLDGVNITSTIVNISKNKFIIKLADNSVNILKDGGTSEYDSSIYSNGPLVIEGNGEDIVTFNPKESFRTLIVSNDRVKVGTYYLYKDGEKASFSAEVKYLI